MRACIDILVRGEKGQALSYNMKEIKIERRDDLWHL